MRTDGIWKLILNLLVIGLVYLLVDVEVLPSGGLIAYFVLYAIVVWLRIGTLHDALSYERTLREDAEDELKRTKAFLDKAREELVKAQRFIEEATERAIEDEVRRVRSRDN